MMQYFKVINIFYHIMIIIFTVLQGYFISTNADNKNKLYLCLNSCAMCVEHWEPGLYNGPRCAKHCIKHKGQRIVDPDCVKLKMFNYEPEVLKQHRKFIRGQSETEEDK